MWVTKLLISPVKKRDLLPKNDQIWPKIGIFGQFGPGHAGIFGALLVGQLVVEARGLYLARHLFTLWSYCGWARPMRWMDHTRQSVTTTRAPVVLNLKNPPEEDVPGLLLVPLRLSFVEIAHRPTFPLAECN